MNIIDKILKQNSIKQKIEVVIGDETLIFRYFKSNGELQEVTNKANEFAEMVIKRPSGPFKALGITYKQDAIGAYILSYLSVEPKISEIDALRITQNPDVYLAIFEGIESGRVEREKAEVEEVIEEKKDSNQTPTTDTN